MAAALVEFVKLQVMLVVVLLLLLLLLMVMMMTIMTMMTTAAANERCPCSPQATYEKKVSRFWGGLSEELSAEFGNLYVTEFGSIYI